MSKADAVIRKLNSALARVGPYSRTVYKRIVTSSGGTVDDLTGRTYGGATTVYTDTAFSPQPTFNPVSGGDEILNTSRVVMADDYHFLFSPTTLSTADLAGKNLQIVLKDSSGNVEVLRVIQYKPFSLNGIDVALSVYARSQAR
jgi:hypothetical protein